jgi:6-phosphogluconolactonase
LIAYIGSLTGDPSNDAASTGISVVQVDDRSGALTCIQTVSGLQSPTYLAVHPFLPVLYAGERDWPAMGPQAPGTGSLTTLSSDAEDGRLTLRARLPTAAAAHLNVHPSGRYVFAAMNRRLQVAVFPVDGDGNITEACATVQHEGRGPKSPNQDRAFPHSCWFDRSGNRVLCCDLGIDRVMRYDLDLGRGTLQPSASPFAQVSSGAGPRHLAFHPTGHWVYVLNELDSTISAFRYDQDSGQMIIVQTVSTLPAHFAGESAAAHILVHPSGKFVYASNRGHDSIAAFAVDQQRGVLSLIAHVPSDGQRPYNFAIDSSGKLMLVANQRSDTIVSFRIDEASGELARTEHVLEVAAPVCVVLRGSR